MIDMSLISYRKLLVGKLYKILPLWELQFSGDITTEVYWKYLNNTLNYMKSHEITHEECRSEVFKMIGQIESQKKA